MAGEELIPMMNQLFLIAVILFTVVCIMTPIAMMSILFTPAISILKSKFGRKSLVFVLRRDRYGKFDLGKYEAGMINTKEHGYFIASTGSTITEMKSGCKMFIADPEIGLTLNAEIIKLIQGLRAQGIPNLEIANVLNDSLYTCIDCKHEGIMTVEPNKPVMCPKCNSPNTKKKGIEFPVIPTETLDFDDLPKFVEKNTSSSLMANVINRAVNAELEDIKRPPYKLLMIGLLVLFVFIGLAIFLAVGLPALSNYSGSQQAAQPIITNGTQHIATNSGSNVQTIVS